jgi:hypothetical protein
MLLRHDPLTIIYAAVSIQHLPVAMRHVLFPLSLIYVSVHESNSADPGEPVITPLPLIQGPVRQVQLPLLRYVIRPEPVEPHPGPRIVTLANPILQVIFKVSLVGVPVVIDHVPLALDLVVDPVALVPAAVLVEDLAPAVLEAVLEHPRVHVPSRTHHHALTLHLTLAEVALVEVAVRECLVTVTVEVRRVVLDQSLLSTLHQSI